jgi:RND superfamily putative drug exporter
MVLVPSVMTILGARAWWLPGWLDRLIPDLALDGSVEEAPAANSTSAQTPKS